MNTAELNKMQAEAYEHLWHGRYRLALAAAEKLFKARPESSEAASLLAWALLENGHPAKALDFANLAVELKGDPVKAQLFRGYILMRMSIFEGAVSDIDQTFDKQKEILAWTYLNKARALAGMGKYEEAYKNMEVALQINKGKHAEWDECRERFMFARDISRGKVSLSKQNIIDLVKEGFRAIKAKDAWFALLVSRMVVQNPKFRKISPDAHLLELEALYNMFQFRPALEKAEKLEKHFAKDEKFIRIYNKLKQNSQPEENEDVPEEQPEIKIIEPGEITPEEESESRCDEKFFKTKNADVFSAKVFDVIEDKSTGKRKYYDQFDIRKIHHIGIEVIFDNPWFESETKELSGKVIWYLNGRKIGDSDFPITLRLGWDAIIFAQTWGSDMGGFWRKGQAMAEVFIADEMVAKKWFLIGDETILQKTKAPEDTMIDEPDEKEESGSSGEKEEKEEKGDFQIHEADEEKSLEELVEELDQFTGLETIKTSVRDFIDYLSFIKERKKLGLKADENVSVNAVFLGNPGTGKTTIARIIGGIFKAMGLLPKGHVVEVDRSNIVGQYVGETAQKTTKAIKAAMGGVLFVDEAYTLVKKGGSGQDFGQEAIDTLLKQMEDKKGEFTVIAAGYPDEMNDFLESNPGMKSRFTQFFTFEDYNPDELFEIYTMMLTKEEYILTEEAGELIKKEYINLYRARDKSFGNARLVRKFFEDTKVQLSKRYLRLPEEERSREAITTILPEDILAFLSPDSKEDVRLPINEESLAEAMADLEKLTGLRSVIEEVNNMIKLARYYLEQGEDIKDKFSSHVMFLGNPGTGKTTVARIFGKIYSALGILPRGHLVETDRQGLVSGYVGQTTEKTTEMIDKSIGGTLFIDEAYALIKKEGGGNDFGKEAVDTLLKRMEDDRGKFIVIAAGYTQEMQDFLKSNPGLQSRFTKTFTFEDYTPDELIEITHRIAKSKKLVVDEDAEKGLLKHFNEIYRARDKNFGNARIVRNVMEAAQQKMVLRLADMDKEERTEEVTKTLIAADFSDTIGKITDAKKYVITGDAEKLEKYKAELFDLTGLDSVKTGVEKLISSLKVSRLRAQRGLRVLEKSLHSVFTGNPGTGKTTVARLMSKIYRELGLIEKGHLVEVDRADLVAGYQGQTAIKTDKIIQSALGGTLFIDEAYTLARGANDFGQEAIDTLLKRMEDHKGQFIIIVAGYPKEMQRFLEANPGMQSRFTNFFNFEDYQPRQLLEISNNIARSNGYELDEGALQLLLEVFGDIYEKRDKNFGNARTAKNVLFKCISNQEERISSLYDHSDEILKTITFEDVQKLMEES